MKINGSGFVFQKWLSNVMMKLHGVDGLIEHTDIDKGQSMLGTLKSIGPLDLASDQSVLEDIVDMCETGSIEVGISLNLLLSNNIISVMQKFCSYFSSAIRKSHREISAIASNKFAHSVD